MKIPAILKIGGIKYNVKTSPSEDLESDTAAKIETNKCLITLCQGHEDFMKITLIHELIHGINMEMPEETVEFLAQALYQVIADNPDMFEGGEQND